MFRARGRARLGARARDVARLYDRPRNAAIRGRRKLALEPLIAVVLRQSKMNRVRARKRGKIEIQEQINYLIRSSTEK